MASRKDILIDSIISTILAQHQELQNNESFIDHLIRTTNEMYDTFVSMDMSYSQIEKILLENVNTHDDLKVYFNKMYKCILPPWVEGNFTRHQVPGDGNCLFSCIGLALNKTASVVRKEICDYMTSNIDAFFNDGLINSMFILV